MARLLVLFIALFLPLQFAWSSASVYCEHETAEPQGRHIGHHVHACKDATGKSADGQQKAHADCGVCQAAGSSGLTMRADVLALLAASTRSAPVTPSPFSSALARAPDRPQWRRLV
jgi:hypothetical protein